MTPVEWGSINYWIRACACAELRDLRTASRLATIVFGIPGPHACSAYNEAAMWVAKVIDRAPAAGELFATWCSDRGIPIVGPPENVSRALFISDLRKRADRIKR